MVIETLLARNQIIIVWGFWPQNLLITAMMDILSEVLEEEKATAATADGDMSLR